MTDHQGPLLDPGVWSGRIRTAGGWGPGGDGELAVLEKATGATLGRIGLASLGDVADAARAARAAQRDWAAASHERRAAVLREAGRLWERHAAEVGDWLVREGGSVPAKAEVETAAAAQECY
ncbi:acyl-CoA reductase-like NAD-dependent aldehyde dehydrogenase [Streptacidiphilus sp. EB129]